MLMDENNVVKQETSKSEDELKTLVEEKMSQLRTQSMLLGAQAAMSVVNNKINTTLSKGKMSYRDYERLIKDIAQFCNIGLSRQINLDGTTSELNEENVDESGNSEISN